MRIAKQDVPVKIDVPGATARQQGGFGDATGYGAFGAEFFSLAAGTDIAGLLEGLPDNLCACPHWGYVIEGGVTVTFKDGTEEQTTTGDLFYWPPGHTVRADKDTELVFFSPQKEHTEVIEHLSSKLAG
jgi:hypothetical protein